MAKRGSAFFLWDGVKMAAQRTAMKISLQGLADQLGTSKSYVWEIEQGRSQPTIGYAYHIAEELQKPVEHFIKRGAK